MSAALAFQAAARAILVANSDVIALIPAINIIDANGQPELFPRLNIGEDQEIPADDVVGRYTRVLATMHVWTREPGLAGAKAIVGAVRKALILQTWTQNGFCCIDTRLQSARYLRDPDGLTAHGVITFKALIEDRT
jgi:hypothetical protein